MREKIMVAVVGIIILISILVGVKIEITKEINKTPQQKFKDNYPLVSDNHPFVKINEKEVLALLDKGTGFLLLGSKRDLKSNSYVSILDEVVKDKIKEINYYEVESDFDISQVKEKLENMLDKNIKQEIPLFLIIKDGQIIGYENELVSLEKKEELENYWTEDKKEELVKRIEQIKNEYLKKD